MKNFEEYIGKNISEVRKEKGLSQEKLANMCEFSNTTLSAYENSKKIPNLVTIAKIAKNLGVSIERLYYGDENNAFIATASNKGMKIVNSIYYLWKAGIITYFENFSGNVEYYDYIKSKNPKGVFLYLNQYGEQIKRLVLSLNEFKEKKSTYPDPNKYLEFLLSSVANEINDVDERIKQMNELNKKIKI